jgi:hypothetical protein
MAEISIATNNVPMITKARPRTQIHPAVGQHEKRIYRTFTFRSAEQSADLEGTESYDRPLLRDMIDTISVSPAD